jgi:hypothetical protein
MFVDLLEVGAWNLALDLFQHFLHSLWTSPCKGADDLASGFLGEGELPRRDVLQLDDLLAKRELSASTGGQIDSPDGNLCRQTERVRGRCGGGNSGLSSLGG